ncbi:FtsX-like permease family protein [Clostridium sp. YIM B02500]|uniref:FtsX-like permease family protein n=1 Tax=Clostridium sp. YIM B02500 TaxID=2910681 RepID=UPI001EEE5433|nr:FtsX-like permease family protein [Clostridium sp. YIM B02500]
MMNIDKFKYFSLDAVKSLKRNSTTTIFSVTTISATFFINGLFLLFLLSIGRSFESIYTNNQAMKEMIMILICFKFAIFIVIPLVSVLLIVNAIKMVLFSRRSEISIMKLIGATNWFIRWPFIIEGGIIGIAGAFVGYLSLFFVYSFIYTKAMEYAPEFSLVQPTFITNIMLFPFGVSGILIGVIGSIIALRKFLNV